MREGLVAVRNGAAKYVTTTLGPSVLTWAGIWNMVILVGIALRHRGVRGRMTVSFWWEQGDERISLEARAVL